MDVVLQLADDYLLDRVWATALPSVPRSILSTAASLASAAGAGQSGGIFANEISKQPTLLNQFGSNFTSSLIDSQSIEHLQNAVVGASEWGSKWQGLSSLPRDNFYR